MTTIFYTATSLDGFIADQHNSLDWLFQFGELEPNTFDVFLAGVGAIAVPPTFQLAKANLKIDLLYLQNSTKELC